MKSKLSHALAHVEQEVRAARANLRLRGGHHAPVVTLEPVGGVADEGGVVAVAHPPSVDHRAKQVVKVLGRRLGRRACALVREGGGGVRQHVDGMEWERDMRVDLGRGRRPAHADRSR